MYKCRREESLLYSVAILRRDQIELDIVHLLNRSQVDLEYLNHFLRLLAEPNPR